MDTLDRIRQACCRILASGAVRVLGLGGRWLVERRGHLEEWRKYLYCRNAEVAEATATKLALQMRKSQSCAGSLTGGIVSLLPPPKDGFIRFWKCLARRTQGRPHIGDAEISAHRALMPVHMSDTRCAATAPSWHIHVLIRHR